MSERPTPETDAAWACFKGYMEPLQDVKDLSRKLERERDEARELHRNALREREKCEEECDATLERAHQAERERDEARENCKSIVDKAKELVARWDQPSWKDTAPTAGFIYALRNAVEAYEKQKP